MKTRADFLYQLQRQLGFIERSCRTFDDGHLDDAVLIAVHIRVLLYDTRQSTSLLTHLGAKATVQLLSAVDDSRGLHEPPGMTRVVQAPLSQFRVSPHGTSHRATLQGRVHSHVSVARWCKQVVWQNGPGTALTRIELVLAAANKDGGAHVDADDIAEYVNLARNAFSGFLRLVNPDESTKNMHLQFLRVLGEEILRSPALRNL